MKYYDENNNLVSISNSFLKYFNCPTFHESHKVLDEVLKNTSKKHICLILLDGLGSRIQDIHKDDCPFIRSHKKCEITSVFPPTTAAATTSLLTGKYPVETGWIGWNEKFKEWDTIVTMFTSRFVDEQCELTPLLTENLCSYKTIFEIMREHNDEDMSFEEFKQFALEDPSIGGYLNKLDEECDKYDFLYAYSTEPDHMLHEFGSGSREVGELIKVIDKGIEVISKRHPDVLFVIVADHGHIICENRSLYEHEDFFSCLKYPQFSIEGRAAAFYVKDDKKEEFRKLATKYYGEDFDIYSKEEVKKLKIFGLGKEHPRFDYAIGDFLLVAKSNKVFTQDFGAFLFSHHAGGTDLEKYINLSIINE